jgi:hypothetical protein
MQIFGHFLFNDNSKESSGLEHETASTLVVLFPIKEVILLEN